MKTHEIVNKLENIVTEALPNSDEWQNQSVHDLVVKYKVRLVVFTLNCASQTGFCPITNLHQPIDNIRILTVGLELACNRGFCGELSLKIFAFEKIYL